MTDPLSSVLVGADAAFPKDEFDTRIVAFQTILRERDIALYLTSGAENIFYLSGQQTPGYYMFQCLCVPAEGAPFLVMRALEAFNARANCFVEDIHGYTDAEKPADALVARFESDAELHVVKASLPYNGLWAVDFTRNGVNKASAARRLAKILGTDASRLIAAGDSHNDLSLLKACGLRIAMGNAPDEVKAIADYVAPSVDEDGLAVAIEEFVLPRL